MKYLILMALALSLQAKTLYVIETEDIVSKCVIEVGDVVVKPTSLDIKVPRGITVVECDTAKCANYTIDRYKWLYRTNGIGIEIIK